MKQVRGTHSQLRRGLKGQPPSPFECRFGKCIAQKSSAEEIFIEGAKRLSGL